MLDQNLTLPEDPEELRSFTARLLAEVKAQAILIEKLRHQLAGHRAHRFGASSETAEQLQLALETSEIAAAAMTARLKLPDVAERDKPKRRPIPDHIPRMEVELTPGAEACADCGGRLRRIGEDVTEELEYVPGRFIVNRIVRPRLTCACCERFVQAPLPSRPIERGRPGPGLLAHVLVSKYADHLPLYRQSQIFDREGIDLDRSTLADWVGKTTALLEPLADAIGRHVLSAKAIFADDTPISMLAPGTGKTQTARLWTYARDERPWGGDAPPAAWYRFSGDRKGQHPKDHLARYRGWMHADGYAGFEDLYRSGTIRDGRLHGPCQAQVRRHPPFSGLPDRRRSHRPDRPTLCRREGGQRLPAGSARRTAKGPCHPGLRRSGKMAGNATHYDLWQIPAGRSNPIRADADGAPAPLSRPRHPRVG
jgi:transposase